MSPLPSLRPRVVVTRARAQSSALAEHLSALGAEPILLPLITVLPPESFDALDHALAVLRSFDWLIFTSSNAVEAVAKRAAHLEIGLAEEARCIAAIGTATAAALAGRGLSCNLVAAEPISERLADALVPLARSGQDRPARFLLLRAQDARAIIPEALTRAGAEVTVVTAYRKDIPEEAHAEVQRLFAGSHSAPQAIAFTSSSTARNLFTLLDRVGLRLPESVLRVSIGPVTSDTLRALGYPPHAEASTASVASLASAAVQAIQLGLRY